MRNLALALTLVAMILVPHASDAKKHGHHKGGAHKKDRHAQRHAKRGHETAQLETLVAEKRADPEPQRTAAAPAQTNEPVNMTNQALDDEVPGSRKKK